MKLIVQADGTTPLTVQLEPSGMEYVLKPGDHFIFEWPEGDGKLLGGFYHSATSLTVDQGSADIRLWNSHGEELSIVG